MQADLSRTTFEAAKHFSAVLSQQGRVQLDADANEQAAILLHQLRTAIADLIGPAGAPKDAQGFVIDTVTEKGRAPDLTISAGRMYVDGILVENDQDTTYWEPPDGHLDPDSRDRLPDVPYGVYLRVWERLITAVQDPALREIALGDPGPDTAARSKVVWQVATTALDSTVETSPAEQLDNWIAQFRSKSGLLGAQALRPDDTDADACHLPPEARFRGPENQLYRVEIHSGGEAWPTRNVSLDSAEYTYPRGATFKWSRENASVVFPIVSLSRADVTVATLGRDGKLALEVGDLVEIVDDATACRVADDVPLDSGNAVVATSLRQVVAIDPVDRLVTLDGPVDADCGPGMRPELNPMLRRWDNRGTATTESAKLKAASDGALPLFEDVWIDLEDGVQVMFSPPGKPPNKGLVGATYRGGDYWQIPARTISGDVLWPIVDGAPALQPPNGVQYSYAPLALISGDGKVRSLISTFSPLGTAALTSSGVSGAEPAGTEPSSAGAPPSTPVASASAMPAPEAAADEAFIPTERAIPPVPQPLVPQPFPRTKPAAEEQAGKESDRFRGVQDV